MSENTQQTIVIGAGRFHEQTNRIEWNIWGGPEDTWVPSKVLEYTLKKHSEGVRKGTIQIINTYRLERPMLRQQRNPTPFSLCRFWVPALVGHKGRAAYLDADQIVFANVQELFDAATGDHRVWQANRESVLVFDCEKLREWDAFRFRDAIDAGTLRYAQFMTTINGEKNVGRLPPEWNALDSYDPGKTKLLHYTNLRTQPWRKGSQHPHGQLWFDLLKEAIKEGEVGEDDLEISGLRGDKRLK